MSYPHINHPEGGMTIPYPEWAEDLIRLAQHQLQAQNTTNQLLQDIKDALEKSQPEDGQEVAPNPTGHSRGMEPSSPKSRGVKVTF